MVRHVLAALGCVAALALTADARADVRTLNGRAVPVEVIPIGGDEIQADGGLVYDNSAPSGGSGTVHYAFVIPAGAQGAEVADDVPYTGTLHVNNFTFAYVTTNRSFDQEVLINFYGALDENDCPTVDPDSGVPVASFDLTGLPGSVIGLPRAYVVGPIDLTAQGLDFDWPNSTDSTGIDENYIGFTFLTSNSGPVLATGGGSQDSFWSNQDLNDPYEAGCFFWHFGSPPNPPPEASFYIQIGGYIQ